MSVPSTKDIQESVEGQEKLLSFIAHAWRTGNWVRVLLVCDAALFIFLNPPLLSKAASFFNLRLLPWYTAAWAAALALIFVSALVVALRAARSAEQAPIVERRAVKGLRPFAFNDAEIFKRLQRNEILRECLVAISDRDFRLGLISGESGCGKTSFLQAGLCPGLQQHGHRCLPIKFTNQEPLLTIRHALTEQGVGGAEDDGVSFSALLEAYAQSEATPVVLLFDQFEQFFIHRRRAERRAFIEALAEWYRREQTPPVKILVCIRSDFSDRLIEMQKVMGYSLGPQESFRLEKFEPEQAVKVFGVIAETEGITFDEGFVAEITSRELASREDGLVSPVDVQILAWMITGHQSLEERAFNRTAYQRLGGVEGLLEKFLKRALAARETEARRQTTIKILLALTNLEQNARAGAMSLEDIKKRLEGSVGPADLEEAVEWLARGDVRLLTPLEQDGRRVYELAHERLIPALRRLAGKELGDADRARQLLDRRVTEWVNSDYDRRYLLSWPEQLLVKRHGAALSAVTKKSAASDLLRRSRRRLRLRVGLACAAALLVATSAAWWYSPWGRVWQIKRELARLSGSVIDSEAHARAAEAFIMLGRCERLDEDVRELSVEQSPAVLAAVTDVCAKSGKKAEVLAALDDIIPRDSRVFYLYIDKPPYKDMVRAYISLNERQRAINFLHGADPPNDRSFNYPPSSRLRAYRLLAEAFATAGENDESYRLIQQALQIAKSDYAATDELIGIIKEYEQINSAVKDTTLLERVSAALAGEKLSAEEDAQISATLAEAYAKAGVKDKAFDFIRRALKATDSVMTGVGLKHLFKDKLPKEFLFEMRPKGIFLTVRPDIPNEPIEGQSLTDYELDWAKKNPTVWPRFLFDSKSRLDSKVRSQVFTPLSAALLTIGESAKDSEYLEQSLAAAAWLDDKDYVTFLATAAETSAKLGDDERCRDLMLASLYESQSLDITEQINLTKRLSRIPARIIAEAEPPLLADSRPKAPKFSPLLLNSRSYQKLVALVLNAYIKTNNKQKALDLVRQKKPDPRELLHVDMAPIEDWSFLDDVAGLVSIARICFEIGERQKSAEYLELARQSAVIKSKPADRAKIFTAIAETYAKLGHWGDAYESATETGNDIDNTIALAEVLKIWAGGEPSALPSKPEDDDLSL